jgi:cytochrome P450
MSADLPIVVHIDPHDRAFTVNPFVRWNQVREQGNVTYSDRHGGFWVVTGYREAVEVLHAPEVFCSSEGLTHPRNPAVPNIVLIETDPPMHGKYRSLVNPHLTARGAEAQEDEIRQLVGELIDGFIGKGSADLVSELAAPLPQTMLFRLLGIPQEDGPRVSGLVHTATRRVIQDPEAAKHAAVEFMTYLADTVRARREAPEQEDLLGVLLKSEIEDRPVSDDEIARLLIVVFSGGLNTVRSQLASTLLYLAEHPGERERLVKDPSLMPRALEEFLRLVSPIQGLFRTVTQSTELGGQRLQKGDKVFVVHAAANRDGTEFTDPDACVLDRYPNRHLAFGLGIHRCVGSHLGRAQVRVGLEEVLRRLPDYEVAGRIRWDVSAGTRGVDDLPVRFTPGPVEALGRRSS